MYLNRNIRIQFDTEDTKILDRQSRICNWLYNQLYSECVPDKEVKRYDKQLLIGRRLRNRVPELKKQYPFLNSVHSSPTKNTALRLAEAFQRYKDKVTQFPKYRSWKKKWFSLFFDEPNKGFKILPNQRIRISLGKDNGSGKKYIIGRLNESLHLRKEDRMKNFRLCKQLTGEFYGVFCIEREEPNIHPQKSWISLDPNHKNLVVGVDNKGVSYEFCNLPMIRYWDKEIDRLKGLRDRCDRKSVKKTTATGQVYLIPSRKYQRYQRAINRAYGRRREQMKSALYHIANWIAKHYDVVLIGDYVPTIQTATEKTMHRGMLNQQPIGALRSSLEWIMRRSGKGFSMVDETDTTKTCCICGHKEKKDPSIREFICPICDTHMQRDINSAINIAKKKMNLSGSDYDSWKLNQVSYTVNWNYIEGTLHFTG